MKLALTIRYTVAWGLLCASTIIAHPAAFAQTGDAVSHASLTIDPAALTTLDIRTAVAHNGALTGYVNCAAYVVADDRAIVRIRPLGTGRIQKVMAYEGQTVHQGQVLMQYDNHSLSSLQQQVHAAAAAVEEAQASRDDAALAAQRAQALRGGALATGEAQRRALVLRHAQGVVKEKQAILNAASLRLSEFSNDTEKPSGLSSQIVAPIDGIVRSVHMAKGDDVAGSQLPIVEIDDLSSVWVVSQVLEADIPNAQKGNRQTTFVAPGITRESTINTVDGSVDPQTRQLLVRSLLPNPDGRLRPGMLVNTRLYASQPVKGQIIPEEAIQQSGARSIVFVRTGNNQYQPREVTTGPLSNGSILVKSGLTDGDVVVTHGSFALLSQFALANNG